MSLYIRLLMGGQKETKTGGTLIRMYNVREHYRIIEKVGKGTYGTVFKARASKDGAVCAIKKLENNDTKLQQEGFPITALREIALLKQIQHPNIIQLREIILSRPNKRNLFRGSTFLLFEYMEHDFAGLFRCRVRFSLPEIKAVLRQLLQGVAYLHSRNIFHRDIKSANILLNDDGEVKLADFGLGRKVRLENMFTYKVVTLWYRAPELLWGCRTYGNKVDVWSIGCVVAEFFTGEVLFRKEVQHAQMERIYEICGDFEANDLLISEQAQKNYVYLADMKPRKQYKKELANYLRKKCPSITDATVSFIESLLHLDPDQRLSCEEALNHPFFSEKPTACLPEEIQKQEYECHEMFKDRSVKIQRRPKKTDDKEVKKASNFKDHMPDPARKYKEAKDFRKDAAKDHYRRDKDRDEYYRSRQYRKDHRYSSESDRRKKYSSAYSEEYSQNSSQRYHRTRRSRSPRYQRGHSKYHNGNTYSPRRTPPKYYYKRYSPTPPRDGYRRDKEEGKRYQRREDRRDERRDKEERRQKQPSYRREEYKDIRRDDKYKKDDLKERRDDRRDERRDERRDDRKERYEDNRREERREEKRDDRRDERRGDYKWDNRRDREERKDDRRGDRRQDRRDDPKYDRRDNRYDKDRRYYRQDKMYHH